MKNDPNTIYILSLTGGGAKGYLSNKFLKRFYERWRLSRGQTEEEFGEIWQNFDVIGGTSVGSIGALSYGLGKSIDEVLDIFKNQAPWIFTTRTRTDTVLFRCNSSEPSNTTGFTSDDVLLLLASNNQFYKAFCDNGICNGYNFDYGEDTGPDSGSSGCSNYGHVRLREILKHTLKVPRVIDIAGVPFEYQDIAKMQDMKTNIVVPVYCNSIGQPVIVSNIANPEYEGQNFRAYEVAMSSSAAPVYLPPYVIEGREYIDGGIYQNSASQVAITAGNYLKKKATRICVVEITTGLDLNPHDSSNTPGFGFLEVIQSFISDSIGGVQANTARDLRIRSKYTLEEINYYSFAPVLDPIGDGQGDVEYGLDSTEPETFAYYDYLVERAFNPNDRKNDLQKIDEMIVRLNA